MVDGLNASAAILSLRQVSAIIDGKALLSDITLDVFAGESVVVLGANGAGKSTLLKVCNGILNPTQGSVRSVTRSDQALIFQRPPLLQRSVLDNVRFVMAARGVAEPDRTERSLAALDACDLRAIAPRNARLLSGGEQQRLALARAWACRPKVLLADEPTANLAPAATRDVERLIKSAQVAGATLILTTHNVAQARRLAKRIVFLEDGRIVEDQPADQFFASPQSAAVRNYLAGESL